MSTTVMRLPRLRPAHELGVPARDQQPSSVDVLGVAGVGRGGDALGPPALGGLRRARSSGSPSRPPCRAPGARAACRFRWASTPARPTRRPKRVDGRLDVGGVLVGAPQVDARRRVRAHRSNVDVIDSPRLGACVRWWVWRSSRTAACSRPGGPARPRSPASGSCPAARSRTGEPLEQAAVREIEEELGCVVEVTGCARRGVSVAAGSTRHDLVLRVVTARLVDGDPVPARARRGALAACATSSTR